MEDLESYRKRLRQARIRSEGTVREIAFPQHDGLFKLPPGRDDLMARLMDFRDKQQKIAFIYDGELTIVSID